MRASDVAKHECVDVWSSEDAAGVQCVARYRVPGAIGRTCCQTVGEGRLPMARCSPMLCCQRMHSTWFRKAVRTTVWALLAWAAVDLGVPSLCALDREHQRSAESVQIECVPSDEGGSTDRPGHIDDCFCCSHCVNAQTLAALPMPVLSDALLPVLPSNSPRSAGYPPYHPPRA